jgi:serine/threonine-protein kinase
MDSSPVLPARSRKVSVDDSSLAAGTRLGRYRILRVLGAGGMGTVYEAVHVDLRKKVALKVLGRRAAAWPDARERFLREARLTARLRHPNVVDLNDVATDGPVAYLVMELLHGEDLSERLRRSGPLAPRELVDLMLPVCSAMIAAHDLGIVHRDLKPQNIFLARTPRGVEPKVLDFGMSKRDGADVRLTAAGDVVGTPNYLAPEQARDSRSATPGSDQYSIGMVFYRCLTNASPYGDRDVREILRAIALERPVALRVRRPTLDEDFASVVERAMSPSPEERFASIRAFARALLPFASDRARASWEGAFDEIDTAELLARRDSATTLPFVSEAATTRPPGPRPAAPSERVRGGSHTWPAVEPATIRPLRRRRGRALVAIAVAVAAMAAAVGLATRRPAARATPSIAAAATVVVPVAPAARPAGPARPSRRIFVEAPLAISVGRPRRAPGDATTPSLVASPPRSRDALVGDDIFSTPKSY